MIHLRRSLCDRRLAGVLVLAILPALLTACVESKFVHVQLYYSCPNDLIPEPAPGGDEIKLTLTQVVDQRSNKDTVGNAPRPIQVAPSQVIRWVESGIQTLSMHGIGLRAEVSADTETNRMSVRIMRVYCSQNLSKLRATVVMEAVLEDVNGRAEKYQILGRGLEDDKHLFAQNRGYSFGEGQVQRALNRALAEAVAQLADQVKIFHAS